MPEAERCPGWEWRPMGLLVTVIFVLAVVIINVIMNVVLVSLYCNMKCVK